MCCCICGSYNNSPFRRVVSANAVPTPQKGGGESDERVTRSISRKSQNYEGQWVHALCATLHNGWAFNKQGSPYLVSADDGVDEPASAKKRTCAGCHEVPKWSIRCHNAACANIAHPACAVVNWFKVGSNFAYCKKSCDSSVSLIQRLRPEVQKKRKKEVVQEESGDEFEQSNSDDEDDEFSEDSDSDDEASSEDDGPSLQTKVKSSFQNFVVVRGKSSIGDSSRLLNGFSPCFPGEPEHLVLKRRQAFERACSCLIDDFQQTVSQANDDVFQEVIDFIVTPESFLLRDTTRIAVLNMSQVLSGQIELVMKSLEEKLDESRLRRAFESLRRPFWSSQVHLTDFINSINSQAFGEDGTPTEPFVLCLQDCESASSDQFDMLYNVLSDVYGFNFKLLLVIHSSPELMMNRLSMKIRKTAEFGLFSLNPNLKQCVEYVDEIIQGRKLDVFPFVIMNPSLKRLRAHFEDHSLSLDDFFSGLRFLLLEHFNTTPFSYLWGPDFDITPRLEEDELEGIFRAYKLNENHVESIHQNLKILSEYRQCLTVVFDFTMRCVQSICSSEMQPSWIDVFNSLIFAGNVQKGSLETLFASINKVSLNSLISLVEGTSQFFRSREDIFPEAESVIRRCEDLILEWQKSKESRLMESTHKSTQPKRTLKGAKRHEALLGASQGSIESQLKSAREDVTKLTLDVIR
jgi:hypothetical protein